MACCATGAVAMIALLVAGEIKGAREDIRLRIEAKRSFHPREVHKAHGRQKLAAEYFERFPKDRYQTEVESWRHLQSQNFEFTMKRLREPIEGGG